MFLIHCSLPWSRSAVASCEAGGKTATMANRFVQTQTGPPLVVLTVQSKIPGNRSEFTLHAQCMGNETVGFKVRTNKPMMYVVNPNRGLLQSTKSQRIEVTPAAYQNVQMDADMHSFVFLATVWPPQVSCFDADLFDALNTTSPVQMIQLTESIQRIPPPMASQGYQMSMMRPVMNPVVMTQPFVAPPMSYQGNMAMNPYGQPTLAFAVQSPMNPYLSQVDTSRSMYDMSRRSQGTLISVHPSRLAFLPPYGYGAQKQRAELVIICRSSETIAYKLQASGDICRFYDISRMQGVIPPGSSTIVDVSLRTDFNPSALAAYKDGHSFTAVALVWPHNAPFDATMYENMERVGMAQKQAIRILIDFDVSESSITPISTPRSGDTHVKDTHGESASSDRYKSQGPDLVRVKPLEIKYKPPFGRKQIFYVSMTNITSKPIAFKIHTNKKEFYYVRPNKGVLQDHKSMDIDLEMSDKFTMEDAKKESTPHMFVFTILKWKHKHFDADLWHRTEGKNKDEEQSITFKATIPGAKFSEDDGDKTIKGSTRRAPKTEESEEFIRVRPRLLAYKPPYGKTKQVARTIIKCTSSEPIAFKIQTNEPKFYLVTPGRGVLGPAREEEITFELSDKFQNRDVRAAEDHKMEICALPWPKHEKEFDKEIWDKLKDSDLLQSVEMKLKFHCFGT